MARSVSPGARAPQSKSVSTASRSGKPSATRMDSASSSESKHASTTRDHPAPADDARASLKPSSTVKTSASARSGAQDEPNPLGAKSGAMREILRAQDAAGVGRTFHCRLEDGRKVQRSHADLLRLAPALLRAFEGSDASSSHAGSPDVAEGDVNSDSSELVVAPSSRRKAQRSAKGKDRAAPDDEDVEMRDASSVQEDDEGASSDEPDDPADGDVSEPSGSGSASSEDESEDEGGATDDSDAEDDLGPRRSRRAIAGRKRGARQGFKPEKEAMRRSARGASRQEKRYDFGDGQIAASSDEDDEQTSSRSGSARATRASTRRTRATATLSSSGSGSPHVDGCAMRGESSDELSIQAQPKKTHGAAPHRSARAAVEDSEYEEDELANDSSRAAEMHHDGEEERPQDHHREACGKCGNAPASVLLAQLRARRSKKKPGRHRKRDDFDEDTDAEEDRAEKYGAWVECGVCCQSYHFGCLPQPQKRELTDMLKAEHHALYAPPSDEAAEPTVPDGPQGSKSATPQLAHVPARPKHELDTARTFSLPKCPLCKKAGGRKCFVCGLSGRRITTREKEELGARDVARKDEDAVKAEPDQHNGDAAMEGDSLPPGLMFRCSKCKRPAHYGCLENDEPDWTFEQHVQSYAEWAICHDCYNYNVPLDVILAWAEADPLPEGDGDDVEPDDEVAEHVVGETRVDEKTQKVVSIPSAKDPRANAKYLVKWQEMSYRQLEWVPHAYLASTYASKLSGFLARGSLVKFDTANDDDPEDVDPTDPDAKDAGEAPLPDPGALERIPAAWRTVDRVLDVWYTNPKTGQSVAFADYRKKLPEDPEESVKLVAQCYMKWGDQPYAASTTEEPPKPEEEGYSTFVAAYKAFLVASSPKMRVPALYKKLMDELDQPRDPKRFKALDEQPDFIAGHKLHDFQLTGVNFLRYRWWLRKGCILADEMGLGKTAQVIAFLRYLNQKEGARPFLVIVPNSLIGNWMREFAQWAPSMRVVPYNGDGESRKIVEDYELFDSHGSLKTHVVLATYEAVAGNARVFRKVDRWDCLVVDEGQRLKAGPDSQLYAAIASLRVGQRVLLTGTPLNNNIKELFNLLAFIDPDEFDDVEALVQEYAELTPERVEKIRSMLKPYFLRRTKETSLDLPPLIEVVVPVSMTVLQRQIYRGILERNAAAIRSIVQTSSAARSKSTKGKKAGSFTNILMELRKALVHPYLVDSDMEPLATVQEAHRNLTDASAKFVLLARMLPKLKAAGHRVLIFSQFKIALNIIERFLTGLDLNYLRLDGDTPQIERQRGVDKFNAPGSEYFAYLLSTRAGGVGLNITSADVVIIYDQDFNPQMDLQAISRAHRMGQTKPVRVFKLVVKSTCEEKILNAGSKKRGLEHLIIQRIDAKDETEDMESMLQFGAQAVFDEEAAEASAIRYTDADIDELLAKTADPAAKESDSAAAFTQAQMWVREKGEGDAAELTVAVDGAAAGDEADGDKQDLHDFWSKVVEKQQEVEKANKAAQAATVGRGKRRRTQVNYQMQGFSPMQKDKKKRSGSPHSQSGSPHSALTDLSSGDEYHHRDELDSDDKEALAMDDDDTLADVDGVAKPPPLARVAKPNTLPASSAQPAPSAPPADLAVPMPNDAAMLADPETAESQRQLTDHETAVAAREQSRQAASRKRRKKLTQFQQLAAQTGCSKAQLIFENALKSGSAILHSNALREGVKVLQAETQALRQEVLANNAAAANAAAPVVGPFTQRLASTSARASPSTSKLSNPQKPAQVAREKQLPRPVQPAQSALAGPSSVTMAIGSDTTSTGVSCDREKAEDPLQTKEAVAAGPGRAVEGEQPLPEDLPRPAGWRPVPRVASLAPPVFAAAIAPAPSVVPSQTSTTKSPPGSAGMVRADSGVMSDSSLSSTGAGGTPKLKQSQLSFGSKPSSATAAPAAAVASTSQVPLTAPASTSTSTSNKVVPHKRRSPSDSSAVPKKRPSPVAPVIKTEVADVLILSDSE